MMPQERETSSVTDGRDSSHPLEDEAWAATYACLSAADRKTPLEPDDLERLAVAAYLVGRDGDSVDVWTCVRTRSRCGVTMSPALVRCAFWLAFGLLNKGELARGGGWVDRAQRLLDDGQLDCVEQGYLRYCAALRSIFEGDAGAGYEAFSQASRIGDRFRALELVTLARVGKAVA